MIAFISLVLNASDGTGVTGGHPAQYHVPDR